MTSRVTLPRAALACVFAALISVGAYIAVPLPGTPVPIVLQNLFIMLAALLLGPRWGLAAVLLYLAMGALGLPVFSGGTGGIARFAGPTGGYLLGYLPATFAMGAISAAGGRRRWWRDLLALLVGTAVIYAVGVPWLKTAIRGSWAKALTGGLLPFIPGDALKIAVAVPLAGRIAPIVERVMPRREAPRPGADPDATEAAHG